MRSYFYLLAFLAFFLGFLVPIHVPPWMSWHSEILVFIAMYFLACASLTSSKNKEIVLPYAVAPFFAMVILSIMQRMFGLLPSWGDVFVICSYQILIVSGVAIGFLIGSKNRKKDTQHYFQIDNLAVALLAASIVSVFIQISQLLSLIDSSTWIVQMPSSRRPGGNIAQFNNLATLHVMAIASLIHLRASYNIKSACLTNLMLIVVLLGLLLTESRAGLLSLFFVALWIFSNKNKKEELFFAKKWAFGLPVFFGASVFFPHLLDILLLTEDAKINMTSSFRLEMWRQISDAILLRPWFGWGLGELTNALNNVVQNYSFSLPFSYSHNILLDIAIGVGIPMAVVFVVPCIFWLTRQFLRSTSLGSWYCVALLIPILCHSFFEFPFAYAYFLFPFSIATGFLDGVNGKRGVLSIPSRLVRFIIFAIGVALIIAVIQYAKAEENFRSARFASIGLAVDQETVLFSVFPQLNELSAAASMNVAGGMSDGDLQILHNSLMRRPWLALHSKYILALELNGRREEAARQLLILKATYGDDAYENISTIIRAAKN